MLSAKQTGRGLQVVRYKGLDGLRGIAAIVVALHHFSMAVPGLNEWLKQTLVLSPFVAGESAVYIFFVLSGFVLFLTFDAKDGSSPFIFIIKRIARIYPPVLAIVVIASAAMLLVDIEPVLTAWFQRSWSRELNASLLVDHLTLSDNLLALNMVLWSLSIEIRFSILFPLLALCVKRYPTASMAGSFAIYLGCRLARGHLEPLAYDPVLTLQYTWLFVSGAWLALKRQELAEAFSRIPGRFAGPMFLVATCFASFSPNHYGALITSLGSFALVALVAFSSATSVFVNKAALFAGKIS